MDFLDKELEKNKKYRDLIYKQLDKDKKKFINEIRTGLGEKIIIETKEEPEKNKISFWEKIKKIFG
jgi:hypothetical protein